MLPASILYVKSQIVLRSTASHMSLNSGAPNRSSRSRYCGHEARRRGGDLGFRRVSRLETVVIIHRPDECGGVIGSILDVLLHHRTRHQGPRRKRSCELILHVHDRTPQPVPQPGVTPISANVSSVTKQNSDTMLMIRNSVAAHWCSP